MATATLAQAESKGTLFFYRMGERVDRLLLQRVDTNYSLLPEPAHADPARQPRQHRPLRLLRQPADGRAGVPWQRATRRGRSVRNEALPTGIYLVKVGNRQAKKISIE